MKRGGNVKKIKWLGLLLLVGLACYVVCSGKYDAQIGMFMDKLGNYTSKGISNIQELIASGNLISEREAEKLRKKNTDIDTSKYNFDTEYYPYYAMLNDKQKNLYKVMYANIMQMSDSFGVEKGLFVDDIKMVMNALYNDSPELFWIENRYGYKYTKNNEVVSMTMYYYFDKSNIEEAKVNFKREADKIIEGASQFDSDYEKEMYVNDYLIERVLYDDNAKMDQSAYSALVNGKSVCAGYARAFQYVMQEMGIVTYYVTGAAMGDHAWNIVKLGDGYYNIDVTWNDTTKSNYAYFNISDEVFESSHTRSELSSNLPKCDGGRYVYAGSGLTLDDINIQKDVNEKEEQDNGSNDVIYDVDITIQDDEMVEDNG